MRTDSRQRHLAAWLQALLLCAAVLVPLAFTRLGAVELAPFHTK